MRYLVFYISTNPFRNGITITNHFFLQCLEPEKPELLKREVEMRKSSSFAIVAPEAAVEG